MATYLADRVIVFEGAPAVAATATPYVLFCCPCFIYGKDLIAFVSPQTTIATHGDEQIPPIVGNNVPSRPDQLPPTCEQTQFGQGQRAKMSVFSLTIYERSFNGLFLFSFGKLLLPRGVSPVCRPALLGDRMMDVPHRGARW